MSVLMGLAIAFVALVLLVGIIGLGDFLRGMREGWHEGDCVHCGKATFYDKGGWALHVVSGQRLCASGETTATPRSEADAAGAGDGGRAAAGTKRRWPLQPDPLMDAAFHLHMATAALVEASARIDDRCASTELFGYAMQAHNQALFIEDYDPASCGLPPAPGRGLASAAEGVIPATDTPQNDGAPHPRAAPGPWTPPGAPAG
jgi:hypothetical protein